MRLPHVEPRVGARPARILAQLVDELLMQPVQVGPGELLVDTVVLRCAIFKGAGDCRDGVDSAEALIQGTLHRSTSFALVADGAAASPRRTSSNRVIRRSGGFCLLLTDRAGVPVGSRSASATATRGRRASLSRRCGSPARPARGGRRARAGHGRLRFYTPADRRAQPGRGGRVCTRPEPARTVTPALTQAWPTRSPAAEVAESCDSQ